MVCVWERDGESIVSITWIRVCSNNDRCHFHSEIPLLKRTHSTEHSTISMLRNCTVILRIVAPCFAPLSLHRNEMVFFWVLSELTIPFLESIYYLFKTMGKYCFQLCSNWCRDTSIHIIQLSSLRTAIMRNAKEKSSSCVAHNVCMCVCKS